MSFFTTVMLPRVAADTLPRERECKRLWSSIMISLLSRLGIITIASFTLTMLLGATADWAMRLTGGGVHLKLILWVLLPITFFLCSIVMEYLEDGSLPHSMRASFFNTGFAAVALVILYVIGYGIS